jgi:hypothetical protein
VIRLLCLLILFSCATKTDEKYLERILTLNEGELLPSNYIQELNSRVLARNLVERLYLSRDQFVQSSDATPFDFQKQTKIVIQFPEKLIGTIAGKCFLNSHQTGMASPNEFQLEDKMIGVKLEAEYKPGLDNPVNELRPKYAYLTFKNYESEKFLVTFDNIYGNVFAELKDSIKKQSTFAYEPGKNIHTFKLNKNPESVKVGNYWEAQIWGKVCFEDVEKFLINCPGMIKASNTAIEQLKKTGRPVIECPTDL